MKLLFTLFMALIASLSYAQTAKVTLINHSGFLIQVGDKKIIIDGIIDNNRYQKADSGRIINQRIYDGIAPFDSIDLILVTHIHSDHFNKTKVAAYMAKYPETQFVAPPNCIDLLKAIQGYDLYSNRVHLMGQTLNRFYSKTIGGIPIVIYYESTDDLHNVYYINLDGLGFLHNGDSHLISFDSFRNGIDNKPIHFLFNALGNPINYKTNYYIPMHFDAFTALEYRPQGSVIGATKLSFTKYVETQIFTINSTAVVKTPSNDKIAIYPNPVTNILNIENLPNNSIVNIYSMDGKLYKKVNANNSHIEMSTSDLSKGIYILKVTSNQGSTLQKFIKQ